MLRSMTGYGRGEYVDNVCKVTVEVRSVNHKYCDVSIKLPRSIIFIEEKIRKRLIKTINRGKIDVYVTFSRFLMDNVVVSFNESLAASYINVLNQMRNCFSISDSIPLSLIASFPDVVSVDEKAHDELAVWALVEPALNNALAAFVRMRDVEGTALFCDINTKLDYISSLVSSIEERSPFVVLEYEERLKKRITELVENVDVDHNRLLLEVAVYADKSSIDEELTRLKSHISQLNCIIASDLSSVGRKLDFVVQEMNREVNTIASKANDLIITQISIELKSEIEKIREQIQNIE